MKNLEKTKLVLLIFIFSIFLVLGATLFPFNFTNDENLRIGNIFLYFNHPSDPQDFFLNIILFFPFGWCLSYLLARYRLKWLKILLVTLLTGFSLSFFVEFLQISLPSRTSSLVDLLSNTLGSFIGFLFLYQLNLKLLVSRKVLNTLLSSYIILTLLLSIPLPKVAGLTNWDSNFYLLLGNEFSGERSWEGYISEVYISDRAISKSEFTKESAKKISPNIFKDPPLAFYRLQGKGNFQDEMGNLPPLDWYEGNSQEINSNYAFLNSKHWLITKMPAKSISEKVYQTSQFTLIANVATGKTHQTGPARIITLSSDAFQRNFTLGQEESNLVFRLRTPITGENGKYPELTIPDIFADTNFHHLVITYADALLQVYVDKIEEPYYIELIPGKALLSYVFSLRNFSLKNFTLLYYCIIFIPLGILLSIIPKTLPKQRNIALFSAISLFFPIIFLEITIANGTSRTISLNNMILSLAIILTTIVVVRGYLRCWILVRTKVAS